MSERGLSACRYTLLLLPEAQHCVPAVLVEHGVFGLLNLLDTVVEKLRVFDAQDLQGHFGKVAVKEQHLLFPTHLDEGVDVV